MVASCSHKLAGSLGDFFAISNLNLNVSFGGLLRQTTADCRETQKQSFKFEKMLFENS